MAATQGTELSNIVHFQFVNFLINLVGSSTVLQVQTSVPAQAIITTTQGMYQFVKSYFTVFLHLNFQQTKLQVAQFCQFKHQFLLRPAQQ